MAVIKINPHKIQLEEIPNVDNTETLTNYTSIEQIRLQASTLNIENVPFDIKSFIQKHSDAKLQFEDMEDLSGCVYKYKDTFKICINKFQNEQRQRFTMAHELAHIIFDYKDNIDFNIQEKILFRDKSIDSRERKANEFAAELLMPQELFVEAMRSGYNTIEKLADKFDVSPAAARYRAYKLGYLKEY